MASIPSPTTTTTTTTAARTTVPPTNTDSLPKTPPVSRLINKTRHPAPKLSYQTTHNTNPQRRDVLIGVGSLCGVTALGAPLFSTPPEAVAATNLPQPLDSVVRTRVARPTKQRSKREKENEEEVLVVSLEQLREDEYVKFDVYINDDYDFENKDDGVTRPTTEYAGSFVSLPTPRQSSDTKKTNLRLALTKLIDDIGADGDDYLDVVMVPKSGKGAIVVKDVKIEFLA